MELYHFFDIVKCLGCSSDFSEYVGKEHSLLKSLDEAESIYCSKDKRDKYYSFLLSKFGNHTELMDIFDTIYFDYPTLCSDLKTVVQQKILKESLLNDNERSILHMYHQTYFFQKF